MPDLLRDLARERVDQALARVDAAAGEQPGLAAALLVPAEQEPRASAGSPRRGRAALHPSRGGDGSGAASSVGTCASPSTSVARGRPQSIPRQATISSTRRSGSAARRRDRREDQEGDSATTAACSPTSGARRWRPSSGTCSGTWPAGDGGRARARPPRGGEPRKRRARSGPRGPEAADALARGQLVDLDELDVRHASTTSCAMRIPGSTVDVSRRSVLRSTMRISPR